MAGNQKPLYTRSTDGRTYVCARGDGAIPDGCWLQGAWDTSGNVTGVRAIRSGNQTMHACGTLATSTATKWSGQLNG